MRLWTLRKGPPFKCHLGDNCSGGLFGKEIDNDGNNRFVCFRSVDRIDVCVRACAALTHHGCQAGAF